jgi:hypothetical protein
MIRVINFFCFALSAFACLALYHVSEQTRVARAELKLVHREIAQEQQLSDALQAEWGRATEPAQIDRAAQAKLAVEDKPAVELASTNLLPRRGDNMIGDAEVRSASAIESAPTSGAAMTIAAMQPGD